jgi:hypothetical protein
MSRSNVPWIYLNVVLAALLFYLCIRGGLKPDDPKVEYKDLITIILTAIAVLLAGVTIIIALLAVWGYSSILKTAQEAAEQAARDTARSIAEPVAARVAEEAVRGLSLAVRATTPSAEQFAKPNDG